MNQKPSAFEPADPVNFDDTAASGQVNLIGSLQPGFVTLNNSALNYTFSGTGAIGGTAGLAKNGSGTLTLLNTGGDNYRGGVAVNAGTVVFGANNSISGGLSVASGATVQVGQNTGAGTLPAGNVTDAGHDHFQSRRQPGGVERHLGRGHDHQAGQQRFDAERQQRDAGRNHQRAGGHVAGREWDGAGHQRDDHQLGRDAGYQWPNLTTSPVTVSGAGVNSFGSHR